MTIDLIEENEVFWKARLGSLVGRGIGKDGALSDLEDQIQANRYFGMYGEQEDNKQYYLSMIREMRE